MAVAPPAGVSQTNFLFAMVFVAYTIYIVLNKDFAKWLGVFGVGSASAAVPASGPAAPAAGNVQSSAGSLLPLAEQIAPLAALALG
jgi:hypothetical protein